MSNVNKKYSDQVSQLLMMLGKDEKQLFLPGGPTELAKLYEKAASEKRQLRIKLGIDPTSTELHLGHTVCLYLLRRFQMQGHKVVLIIGGFTAMVGDPSGRNEARPPLTYNEVCENAKTYLKQVSKILNTEDKKLFEVHNNYDWLSKLSSVELVKLAHLVTINKLIAKEAFGGRIDKGEPLYLHEVLYPLLQGYDSVQVKADIEIGGIDQTFNVLFGRDVQKYFGQEQQFVILNPLLIGLDGHKKMSKTFNNYISLNDPPGEVFGKTMSISDDLILSYFNLTDTTLEEIATFKAELEKGKNPKDVKMELAFRIVKQLHGLSEANLARENFIKQFKKNEIPDSVETFSFKEPKKIIDIMFESNLVSSKAEAKRLIDGGGVKLKSVKISDPNLLITKKDQGSVLQIGKRKFVKII